MDDSTMEIAEGSVPKDHFTYTSIFSLQQESISLDQVGSGACRSVNEFDKVRKLGEVALKQVRLDMKKEGVSISVIREIHSLMDIEHENIVRLFDCAVGKKIHKIFLVMEYCNQDLASLLDNMQSPFTESQVKCLLLQLLKGLNHLHKSFLIHRDIKVRKIIHLLGTPTERIWPGLSKLTLMSKVQLFNQPYNNIKAVFPNSPPECIDPARRATAAECLESEYLNTSPLPCDPSMMPSLTGLTRKSRKRVNAE